jgi:hypothetical protein
MVPNPLHTRSQTEESQAMGRRLAAMELSDMSSQLIEPIEKKSLTAVHYVSGRPVQRGVVGIQAEFGIAREDRLFQVKLSTFTLVV